MNGRPEPRPGLPGRRRFWHELGVRDQFMPRPDAAGFQTAERVHPPAILRLRECLEECLGEVVVARKKEFERKLEELWHRRTSEIRRQIGLPLRGMPYAWSGKIRKQGIEYLIDLTTEILRDRAKKELDNITNEHYSKMIRGRGDEKRHDRLMKWAKHIRGPIIYSFFRGRNLIYVGRGTSFHRLNHYRNHTFLRDADKVKVFTVKGTSQLPKAECLMIHLEEPRLNRARASRAKYCKACPVCRTHSYLKKELKILYD